MVLPENFSYNLAIIFPVFPELVNVLNNYCFVYIKYAFGHQKGIFCMKIVIM